MADEIQKALRGLLQGYALRDGAIQFKDKRKTRDDQAKTLFFRYLETGAPELTLSQFQKEAKAVLAEAQKAPAVPEGVEIFDHAEDLALAVLNFYGIEVSRSGREIRWSGHQSNLGEIRPLLEKFTEDYNRSIPTDPDSGKLLGRPFKPSHIRATFEAYILEQKREAFETLRDRVAFREDSPVDPDELLGELLDILGVEGDRAVFVAGFKHWAWSVKRYLFGLPVVYHLMISIFGGQGKGKTFFVQNLLCGPLSELYAVASLDSILDPREVGKWTEFLVINFEELSSNKEDRKAGIPPALVSAFKRLLTQDRITFRELYSHRQTDQVRTFAAIATTNVRLSSRLGDSSGMRRFLEMESVVPEGETYRDRGINSLDWEGFWNSIDEGRPEGYLSPEVDRGVWERLQEIQAGYIPVDTVDHWLENGDRVPVSKETFNRLDEDDLVRTSPRDIYADYRAFCEDSGFLPLSLANFRDRLLEKDIHREEYRVGKFRIWALERDPDEGVEE